MLFAHKINYSAGRRHILQVASLQTGHREKEASCAACLHFFQVGASVLCGSMPFLLPCVRFSTVDTPTWAIWLAYKLHHLLRTAAFRVKLCRSVTHCSRAARHPLFQSWWVEIGRQHAFVCARGTSRVMHWDLGFLCRNTPSRVCREQFHCKPFGRTEP